MIKVKGKVKIYEKTKKIMGKTYKWKTAVIEIPSKEIWKLQGLENKEVEALIITEQDKYINDIDKFLKKFSAYKPEFFEQKEKQLIKLETKNAVIIYIHNAKQKESTARMIKQIHNIYNKPIILTNNVIALEKALNKWKKYMEENQVKEITEKQRKTLINTEIAQQTLKRTVEKLIEKKKQPRLQF